MGYCRSKGDWFQSHGRDHDDGFRRVEVGWLVGRSIGGRSQREKVGEGRRSV